MWNKPQLMTAVADLLIAAAAAVLLVAGVLGLAYVLALLTVEGPRAALAQSRAMLRMPFLRA